MLTTICGHTFFVTRGLRRTGAIVLDLGANSGEFTTEIARRFPVSVHAVEAAPTLCERLPHGVRIHKHNVAVAGADGPVAFNVAENPEGSSIVAPGAETIEIPGLTFASLLDDLGLDRVDLAKVDIEGAELALFNSDPGTLRRVTQWTVEFHDFVGIGSLPEIAAIVHRLEGLGFYAIKFSANNTDWVFVSRGSVSDLELMLARRVMRLVRGLGRRLARTTPRLRLGPVPLLHRTD